eukprot:GHVU01124148.1.p2 GENE.GHVU01124148.1~~GHVU01124148.1.p2  ORF type:complete len:103 (+),score=2.79 GHVU01124148.1:200-508(+)
MILHLLLCYHHFLRLGHLRIRISFEQGGPQEDAPLDGCTQEERCGEGGRQTDGHRESGMSMRPCMTGADMAGSEVRAPRRERELRAVVESLHASQTSCRALA